MFDRRSFEQEGILHLSAALDTSTVLSAKQIIDELFDGFTSHPEVYTNSYNESVDSSPGNIDEINHCLRLSSRLREHPIIEEARLIARSVLGSRAYVSFDHAIYKSPGSGRVLWHQDDAYKQSVRRMRSITMWIPLMDVSLGMGCMCYAPTSRIEALQHHERDTVTGSLCTAAPPEEFIVREQAKLGDVLIHSPRTMHCSLPNRSGTTRKAWILHFAPWGRFEPFLPSNLPHLVKQLIGSSFG